jgi:hypothetical protein
MRKRLAASGTLAIAALALWLGPGPVSAGDGRMPEFTRQTADAWLNTAPLKAADFRGKVVLLEVYASG